MEHQQKKKVHLHIPAQARPAKKIFLFGQLLLWVIAQKMTPRREAPTSLASKARVHAFRPCLFGGSPGGDTTTNGLTSTLYFLFLKFNTIFIYIYNNNLKFQYNIELE